MWNIHKTSNNYAENNPVIENFSLTLHPNNKSEKIYPDNNESKYMYKKECDSKDLWVIGTIKIINIRNDMAFTWIPFYREFAQKLLQYRNNRIPLVEWIYSNIDGSLIKHFKDAPDGRRVS